MRPVQFYIFTLLNKYNNNNSNNNNGSITTLFGLDRFFNSLILHAVGRTPWTGDLPIARQLPKQKITQNKKNTNIHAWSGILTQGLGVWMGENS
jgi:hypothetical protein